MQLHLVMPRITVFALMAGFTLDAHAQPETDFVRRDTLAVITLRASEDMTVRLLDSVWVVDDWSKRSVELLFSRSELITVIQHLMDSLGIADTIYTDDHLDSKAERTSTMYVLERLGLEEGILMFYSRWATPMIIPPGSIADVSTTTWMGFTALLCKGAVAVLDPHLNVDRLYLIQTENNSGHCKSHSIDIFLPDGQAIWNVDLMYTTC